MKTEFINEKAQSAFNLNIVTSPIVAIILLLVGDSLGAVIFTPISFLLPFSETLSVSFELFAFAFISLMVILWARYIEKSPWVGLGFTKKVQEKIFYSGGESELQC